MHYQIHCYAPKTGRLTPAMIEWLYQYGSSPDQPEENWPIRKVKPDKLGAILLALDPTLLPEAHENGDLALHYPLPQIGLRLYLHPRGAILTFPFSGGALAKIVLGIAYTYIRFLYEQGGFWSYDPQLNLLSFADDFRSIDETAELMEALLPKLLEG